MRRRPLPHHLPVALDACALEVGAVRQLLTDALLPPGQKGVVAPRVGERTEGQPASSTAEALQLRAQAWHSRPAGMHADTASPHLATPAESGRMERSSSAQKGGCASMAASTSSPVPVCSNCGRQGTCRLFERRPASSTPVDGPGLRQPAKQQIPPSTCLPACPPFARLLRQGRQPLYRHPRVGDAPPLPLLLVGRAARRAAAASLLHDALVPVLAAHRLRAAPEVRRHRLPVEMVRPQLLPARTARGGGGGRHAGI